MSLTSWSRPSWLSTLPAALLAGGALFPALTLSPPWWWVWLAPVPLLWLVCTTSSHAQARVAAVVAALIGSSAALGYYRLVMPLPAALAAMGGQALLWCLVVLGTRRVVRRIDHAASVLAYPLLWTAVDTLTAALLPDANWGSLAYTQAGVLPLLQLTSLAGTGGLLFVLCLPASCIAVLAMRRHAGPRYWHPAAATALLLALCLGFGTWRLHAPFASTTSTTSTASTATLRIGMASIDDAIGTQAAASYWKPIRDRYDAHVAELAEAGAELVLLPEKIAVLSAADLPRWQQHYAAVAHRHRIWLALGIAADAAQPRNLLWLFAPDGRLHATYEKHIPAPPERAQHYTRGNAYTLADIAGARFGMAICKDMHVARFDRAYGGREVAAMLVPAWDFAYLDADLTERMSATRGVENGHAVVRAAREGWLSVSDARGRILARQRSAPMPGATLLTDIALPAAHPTLYTRIGDAFGWLCAALALMLLVVARTGRGVGAPR